MSMLYALGLVTGTTRELQLPVSVWNHDYSTIDGTAAIALAYDSAPPTILNLTKTETITLVERSRAIFQYEITYRRQNEVRRRSNCITKAKKLYNFLAPVGVYMQSGDETSTNEYLKWNTDKQGGLSEYNSGKPITVDPLQESRTLDYSVAESFVTESYIDDVEDLVSKGCFNNSAFEGKSAGTWQLVRVSATERDDDDWELSFGFGKFNEESNLDVGGGIIIPTLRGSDHYWLKFDEVFEDATIQPKPVAAIVGQAWPLADFSVLNLP